MFCSELRRRAKLIDKLLKQIFTSHPHLKIIFESNLPKHLIAIKDCYQSKYLLELSDDDCMTFLRNLASQRNSEDLKEILKLRSKCVFVHANELLHLSAQSANYNLMNLLLNDYKADTNSCYEGKTVPFKVKLAIWSEDVIELLKNKRGFNLACFLVKEKGVSLTRFLIDLILEQLSSKNLKFLLSVGHCFGEDEFLRIVEDGEANCMEVFISHCKGTIPFVEFLAGKRTYPPTDALKYFFEHETVRGLIIAKGRDKPCRLIDLHFFSLSLSADFADYFCSIGVDARNLIGSGRMAIDILGSYCVGNI